MAKKNHLKKVHPTAPIYSSSTSSCPSTSSSFPMLQLTTIPQFGHSTGQHVPVYAQANCAPASAQQINIAIPSSLSAQQQKSTTPMAQCFFGLPPPPYPSPYSLTSCSTVDTYSTSNCPPPLPEREEIVIGGHAARFNIKQNHLHPSKTPNRKRFINPIVSGRRKCTDVPCSLLFLAFLIGWGFVAYFGFKWGRPERLLHPTDSTGRMCGVEKKGYYDLRSKPYLLYFDITKCASYSFVIAGCQTPQICVESCPTKTYSYIEIKLAEKTEFQKLLHENVVCVDSVNKTDVADFNALRKLVDTGLCAKYIVSSAAILGRCMPDFFTKSFNKMVKLSKILNENGTAGVLSSVGTVITEDSSTYNDPSITDTIENINTLALFSGTNRSVHASTKPEIILDTTNFLSALMQKNTIIERIASDISVTWWQIIILLVTTAFVSFLWTVIMRIFGALLIWTTVFFVVITLGTGSGYCWWRYKLLLDEGAINDYSFYPNINVYFGMPTTWMVIAIILSIFAGVIAIILFCIRSRITLAIALIQESSKAVGAIASSLFLPIILFLLHITIFAAWGIISIWIASSGTENCRIPDESGDLNNGTTCDCSTLGTENATYSSLFKTEQTCQYVNITRDENQVLLMQVYNMIGFLWSIWFVSAICDVTLAGAFASYYWAFNKKKDVPTFPVLLALRRVLRYHLGTVAFGSLMITTVKMFRIILDFIDRKLQSSQNQVAKVILKCFKCIFWCVEVFLKFLTKNAYILTAVYGSGFFTAAKDSFSLIWNNAIRYAVLVKITDFLLFLGKITITIGMGIVAFHWFAGKWSVEGLPHVDLYYYFVPITVVIVGAYLIADLFFDVYEMAVRTTFLCFLEDAQNNDGTPDKPYYMSNELKKIMGLENQFKCSRS